MIIAPNSPSPPVVLAESVSWQSPTGRTVLDRVTLALHREKCGLVGDNGSGKTTLARILAGELAPTGGTVAYGGTVALLPQDFAPLAEQSVAQALGIDHKLVALTRLTAGEGLPDDLTTLDDDWTLETRIAALFHRLDLSHVALDRRVGELSGGETTGIVLAAQFLKEPDLIVLDEPTNNLDRPARQALYDAIRDWNGGLLVASHDRELLNRMGRIVELSPHGVRSYGGNYELYAAQVDAEAAAAEQDLKHASKELRKARRHVQETRERQERRSSRGKKSRDQAGMSKIALNARRESSEQTTSRLANNLDSRLRVGQEAVAAAQVRVEERRELDIVLSPVKLPDGKTVLDLENLTFRYPGSERGDRHRIQVHLRHPIQVHRAGW